MVWNMSSRSLVYRSSILSAAPLLSLALDPKLPRVAIGSADGKLRIFDLEHPAFRCLQTLDVDAWLRREESKQIELQKSQAAVASAADNKVISSKKMWKNGTIITTSHTHSCVILISLTSSEYDPMSMRAIDAAANEIIGSSNATTESNDIGRPLLSLSFIYHSDTSSLVGSTQSRALSSASVPSPLLVMTSYSLLLIDTATCSVQGSVWFTQEQMLTMQRKAFHQLSAIDQIGFVGNATFSERRSRVDIVIASAFAPQLSLIELDFAPKSSLSGLPAVDESDQSDDDTSSVTFDDGSDDETNASDLASISVFARDMDEWSQDSPLRNASFVAAQPQGIVILRCNSTNFVFFLTPMFIIADKSTGKKSKGVVQSKPVTFHSRVKSSGYGSVAPVRTMFGKKLPVKPKAKPVSPDERSYPVDCDMLNNFQKQHSVLPAPLHGGAILKASYSHDATRVLSCSMDGTARITKLPIAKHKGDGVQLVGHSGPVRDACFSCDSSLVATASADRTVRVWRGQGAEAAMVISNMVQNRSSVATATSSSVSDVASVSFFFLV
jgi:WD40 repeat protein